MPETRSAASRRLAVLFVCLGNICRSPMAVGVFRHMVAQAGLSGVIAADSAGTGAWHVGQPAHPGTRRVLQKRGIEHVHSARVVTQQDFTRFDYLVAMDRANLRDLRVMGAGAAAELVLLLSFAPQAGVIDVPDPYLDGRFDEVHALVEQGCRGLLAYIIDAHGL